MGLVVFLFSLFSFFAKKKYLVIIFLLLLSTNILYFVNPYEFIGSLRLQVQDLALVLLILLVLLSRSNSKPKIQIAEKSIVIFYSFLFLAILIDVISNRTNTYDIISTSRNYLFLIIFFIHDLSTDDIKKALDVVVVIAVFNSAIYLLQYVGVSLYASWEFSEIGNSMFEGRQRYGNFPPLNYLVIFYLIRSKVLSKKKWPILVFLLLTSVISLTRSILVSLILTFIITSNYFSFSKKVAYSVFIVGILIIVFEYFPVLKTRFSDGYDDIIFVFQKGFTNTIAQENFSFRIALLVERLGYIFSDLKTTIFGIGFIHEKNFLPIFSIGLKSQYYSDQVSQLDTSDISWALLFLRLGILGTFIYTSIYIKILKYFKNFYTTKAEILTGYSFIVFSLLISFTSAVLISPHFIITIGLLYKLVQNETK